MPGSDDPQRTPAPAIRGASVPTPSAQYNGFVAGIFSGLAKLAVGHPFDTIKVRLQTTTAARFGGPVDCVRQTFRQEGVRGFYKGATPPLVGWALMDSLMLGSLTLYKSLLREHVFGHPAVLARYAPTLVPSPDYGGQTPLPPLPVAGHALAGTGAGWTVSFLAAPVEHVKARLQVQYSASKERRLYSGPVDCVTKIVRPELFCSSPLPFSTRRVKFETDPSCHRNSSARTASTASSAACPPRSTSAPAFAYGGAPTTGSHA